jgi:hypothetical protein
MALGLAGVLLWAVPLGAGEAIVFEDVTAQCGIHRQKMPMEGDKVQADKMQADADYIDWPFDIFCGDLDGDGHVDILTADHHPGKITPGGIYLGKGDGSFTANSLRRLVIRDEKGNIGGIGGGFGTALDIDGDGKMDFICSEGQGLYLNQGTEGQGDARGIQLKLIRWGGWRGWAFGDFNRDGNLDVATGAGVYLGGGKGTLPPTWKASESAGEIIRKFEDPLHHCLAVDLRRSGAGDILCGQAIWRWAWGNRKDGKQPRGVLLANDGKGNFTEQAEPLGLAEMSSTGPLVAADFNNDGRFEVFSVGLGNDARPAKARIYVHGDGKFAVKDAVELGVAVTPRVTGIPLQYCCASAVDLDNDGLIDLIVADGTSGKYRIFRNLGDLKFEEVTSFKVSTGHEPRFAAADFNEDGLLDLAALSGPNQLVVLLNRTQNSNRWLEVKVKGTEGNVCGIGALIEVFRTHKLGDRTACVGMQHVVAENQNHVPLEPHFGLGQEAAVDVRVTLPTGEVLEAKDVKAKTRALADFQANTLTAR